LFKETFGDLFTEEVSLDLQEFVYEDFRKFCQGAKQITGASGETRAARNIFSDPTRSFVSVQPGAILEIDTGVNVGTYEVAEVLTFTTTTDATERAYTTSPTGLSGTATVTDGVIEDVNQDFSQAVENEILTFTEGPNIGSYRLECLVGPGEGLVGFVTDAATKVIPSPSLLRLRTRMPSTATGQTYTVGVDLKGIQEPRSVVSEDVSVYFII
ncbi:MAG: hypothetical protein AAGM67_12925, partial [Bacteroidota bacterium]